MRQAAVQQRAAFCGHSGEMKHVLSPPQGLPFASTFQARALLRGHPVSAEAHLVG